MSSTPSSTRSPERPTVVRYIVLGVLCSLAFLTYLDRICISRAQENIKKDLHLDALTPADEQLLIDRGVADDPAARESLSQSRANERMGWIFSAFQWGYVLFEIPGGLLGDTWGVRRVLLRIVVWWSVFTAATGSVDVAVHWLFVSPSLWTLIVGMILVRVLFGMGEAGAFPNISRVLSRWFPARERARVQGTIWLASRWGGALAPVIFGSLLRSTGGNWRGSFLLLGIVGVVWAVAFWWWFRDRPEDMPACNRAECELIQAGKHLPGSIYDDGSHAPLLWRRLLLSTNLWAMYLAASCSSFAWYFYASQLPTFLKEVHKVRSDAPAILFGAPLLEIITGLPLLGGGLCCILGGLLSDFLIRRTGSRRWGRSLPGVIAFFSAGLCLALVPFQTSLWAAVLLIVLSASLQDLHMAALWSLTADVGGRYAGTLAGTMNMVCNFGGAAGMLIVPYLVWPEWARSWSAPWALVFWLNAAMYFVGALLWLRVDANERLLDASAVRLDAAV